MILIRKLQLCFLVSLVLCGVVSAQTTDYVYGIQFGQGTGLAGDSWNLEQLTISVDGGGTATSYAYSYNNNASANAGTFNASVYAIRFNGISFGATQIYNYSEAAGAAGTAGVIGSGGDPGSQNVGSGWFTKGTFYNGSYYAGVQQSTNNLVRLTLGPGENSVTTAQVYTNINHGGANANTGGDLVISGGNLYISGRIDGTSGSSFATTTLANATNGAGSSWNAVTDAGNGQYYYQLAGLGQITNLYGFASGTGSPTFGQLTNYDDPSVTTPTFTTIAGTSPIIFADLSEGSNQSILLPEPAQTAAGIVCAVAALFEFVRWRKSAARRR
jgi:hypothetical protein